jgi:hypothetical protein
MALDYKRDDRREGCAGVQVFFGAKSSSARYLAQIPGTSAKMSRRAFVPAIIPQS